MKLHEIGDEIQRDSIIPHCPTCSRPCCNLDDLVLDLSWPQTRALYQITSSRNAFNRNLPSDIRMQHGRYYAHGKPCPAYVDRKCAVYDTDAKPEGCSDFPIYEDGDDVLTVDTRCEAVDLDAIEARLRTRFAHVERTENDGLPDLISFVVR